ncbi:MAG: TolC family protein, partial [Gemmatimonadaceae bacterium]
RRSALFYGGGATCGAPPRHFPVSMSRRARVPGRPFMATPPFPLALLAFAIGCASAPPQHVSGGASTADSPATPWAPPPSAAAPLSPRERHLARRGAVIPAEPASHMGALTLADVVDVALGNSPITRTSWSQARAAAADVGSAKGRYLPTLDLVVAGGPSRAISANPARLPAERTTVTPSLTLQYLLFDFGGRGGAVSAAREALFAADFTHNASIQDVVLQTEQAYFLYQTANGLLAAAVATVENARANLAAAERRHEVGVATIADILQARTALAQAQLQRQSADGNRQGSRANLALAMGLVANATFDVAPDSGAPRLQVVAESVDTIIAVAERSRPDVAAARAIARSREASVRIARSALFPALTVGSTAGRSLSNVEALQGRTYALTFGVSVPIFSGLARQYDVVAAREDAAAAASRADQLRLEAAAQVYTSYFALRTAAQRIATAAELLTSATQSEEVARGRYAEGVGSILDVLTAQNALSDARAQSVQARWTWYSSLAELARNAGILSPRGDTPFRFTTDSSGSRTQ